jgi:REP element-mobilizing transposase RayT
MSEHAHILFRLSKNLTLSKIVERVKTSSSKWVKSRQSGMGGFQWQSGYGGFSVSPEEVDQIANYVEQQEAHHTTLSFQDEYRRFLVRYRVEYDERYVWD